MAKTQIRPEQAKTLAVFDDQKAAGAALEDTTLSLEGFLQGVISQVNRVIHTSTAGNDWHADLSAPGTFEGGTARGVDALNQELHDLERRRLLTVSYVLESINVPAGQNWVLLNAAPRLPPNLTAAVGAVDTLGTVVAAHTGAFGSHSLDVVTGFNSLAPKNLVALVDATTRDPILSSERRVYGLLQSESATDGHTILANTPNRVQISFVRLDVTGGALEAVPVADIEARDFNYYPIERIAFEDFDEQVLLPGALFDTVLGGAGGGGGVDEAREEAVATALISANTLIEGPGGPGAPNLDIDLLDYSGVNFATVKIYLNGRLLRNGTGPGDNFDVYPSALGAEQAVGAFYCEFDIQAGDTIQMILPATGGGGGGGGTTDHGALDALSLLDDDHPQYARTDGTREQDGVLLSERADHVNAPAAGKVELWLKDNTYETPFITTQRGDIGVNRFAMWTPVQFGLSTAGRYVGQTSRVPFYTYQANGIDRGATQGAPNAPLNTRIQPIFPFDVIVRRIHMWYDVAVSGFQDAHFELWKWTLANGLTTKTGAEVGFSGGWHHMNQPVGALAWYEVITDFPDTAASVIEAGEFWEILPYQNVAMNGYPRCSISIEFEKI